MLGRGQLLEVQKVKTLRRVYEALTGTGWTGRAREPLLYALMGVSTGRLPALVSALEPDELRLAARRFHLRIEDRDLRAALSWRLGAAVSQRSAHAARLLSAVERTAAAVDAENCPVRCYLGPPATSALVDQIEAEFAVALPDRLSALFRDVAGVFAFTWSLDVAASDSPHQLDLDTVSDDELNLFRGRLTWDAPGMLGLSHEQLEVDGSRVVPLFAVGGGDLVAAQVRDGGCGRIVWWSHDGDARHGRVLAHSLDEWLAAWESIRWLDVSSRVASLFGDCGHDELARVAARLESLIPTPG